MPFLSRLRTKGLILIGLLWATTAFGTSRNQYTPYSCHLVFSKSVSFDMEIQGELLDVELKKHVEQNLGQGIERILRKEPTEASDLLKAMYGDTILHDVRIRQNQRLKDFFRRTRWWDESTQSVRWPTNVSESLELIRQVVMTAAAEARKLSFTDFALPGLFSYYERDGKFFLENWHFSERTMQPGKSVGLFMANGQMGFYEWGEVIATFGIIPASLGGGIFYHDFAHMLAALAHPYEELVLQKQFYREFVARDRELFFKAKSLYGGRMKTVANVLFEGFELPKPDSFLEMIRRRVLSESDLSFLKGLTDAKGLLSADTLKLEGGSLNGILDKFRTILSDDEWFHRSFDGFGGDFYDIFNHYRKDGNVLNYVDAGHGWIEQMRHKALDPAQTEVLQRLFVAYYNQSVLKLKFESFYDAALNSAHPDTNGVPLPWIGTPVEDYFSRYADDGFWKNGIRKDLYPDHKL